MSLNEKYDTERLRRVILSLLFVLLLMAFIPWHQTVTVKGYIRPKIILPIVAHEDGTVVDVFVTAGQSLSKGQPLLQIENTMEERTCQSIRQEEIIWNDYAQSQCARIDKELEILRHDGLAQERLLSLSSLKHSYSERLFQEGFITEEELHKQSLALHEQRRDYDEMTAETSYKTCEKDYFVQKGIKVSPSKNIQDITSEINLLSRQVQLRNRNLEGYRLVSPIEGVVISENPQNLQDNYVRKDNVLMEIADPRSLEVRTLVSDSEIALISPGQSADVKVWISPANEFQVFPGKITHIGSSLGVEGNRNMFIVHVDVHARQAEKLIKVGASAKVKIKIKSGNTYQHLLHFVRGFFV
jgi:multidrug resistance efflux pump